MELHVTSAYATALAVVFIALSVRTLRLRRELRIGIGVADNERLLRATRAHGNFAEYVPLTLLLILLLDLQGAPHLLLHGLGASLSIGRVVHAYGVSHSPGNYRYRVTGMALTFIALGGAASALLALALG